MKEYYIKIFLTEIYELVKSNKTYNSEKYFPCDTFLFLFIDLT